MNFWRIFDGFYHLSLEFVEMFTFLLCKKRVWFFVDKIVMMVLCTVVNEGNGVPTETKMEGLFRDLEAD